MAPPQMSPGPSDRSAFLERLALSILAIKTDHPVKVGIDGVDGAGKTTLADDLVDPISRSGREVIRASIDGFHRPRSERLRRGAESPEGYYLDSFNHEKLWSSLLAPLGPGGSRVYRAATFDVRTDRPRDDSDRTADRDAVLIFDGVFLFRPEINAAWDYRIFLAVGFKETLRRVTTRDQALIGPPESVIHRYQRRYIPGQRLYLESVQPRLLADIVVDNTDPGRPVVAGRTTSSRG